jgi:hypothetical protein
MNDDQDNLKMPPPPPPPVNHGQSKEATKHLPKAVVTSYIALGIALVGSFLPWARVLFFTVNGTDGDGVITAAAAGAGIGFLFGGTRSGGREIVLYVLALVASLISAGVYVYHFRTLSNLGQEQSGQFSVAVQPGAGLIIGTLGAVVGSITLLVVLFEVRRQRYDFGKRMV